MNNTRYDIHDCDITILQSISWVDLFGRQMMLLETHEHKWATFMMKHQVSSALSQVPY